MEERADAEKPGKSRLILNGLLMPRCPNCNGKLPFRKFFLMSNFSVIRCPHCHARLVPDKKVLSLIGGLGGMAAALTVGLASTVFYLLERSHGLEIILASVVLVILIYLATVFITRNVVDFKVDDEGRGRDWL